MSNSHFQFKQFRIDQLFSAQKVTTAACIFGSWIDGSKAETILDIGTGTGLLSLMLAQQSSALISAIEIERSAYVEAVSNFQKSKWASRISVANRSFQEFIAAHSTSAIPSRYNLIICNPPFFRNSLLPRSEKQILATHQVSLTVEELVTGSTKLLAPGGRLAILIPAAQEKILRELLGERNGQVLRQLTIQPKTSSPSILACFEIEFDVSDDIKLVQQTDSICIHQESGEYTAELVELLRPYYLNL